MSVNLKLERSIVEVVGGVENVLENLSHSPTEPIFRQNGYEVNGDKKPFALEFDSGNSEYLSVGTTIPLELGSYIELKLDIKTLATTQIFVSDGSSSNYLSVLADGRLFVTLNGSVQTATLVSIGVGLNTVKFRRDLNGDNYISANGGAEQLLGNLPNIAFPFRYVGRVSSTYYNLTLYNLSINNEQFNLTEGLGNKIYGSNGTVGTINTSHADGIQRVNFGMWLKGDDTNGWNPYTV